MSFSLKSHFGIPVIACITAYACAPPKEIITKGMIITSSTTIKADDYFINGSSDLENPIITIQGKGITVNFSNAILYGSENMQAPNKFTGVAVLVKDSEDITITNLSARGYKVAVYGDNVKNLQIKNCDFSYNYRKRLVSTQEKEDLSDWMSYHHNEKNEWLRYGAAIYLTDCDSAVLENNHVNLGQNALLMTRCNHGKILNNNFSFNSSLGIGLYASSNNVIAHNKVNFNVRGYSHGVYHRGQDSAGILVYDQSSDNIFYQNSVTHSGDGFFLWAGQHTMDTGEGGCNNNVLYQNDFSYAPTNGIEVTFSKNIIISNKIHGCDHGIWGGYSFDSEFYENDFDENRVDIAIEHGQNNQIVKNNFQNSQTAIQLWSRDKQPAGWGYSKNRDTRSKQYTILDNDFTSTGASFDITKTENVTLGFNEFTDTKADINFGETVKDVRTATENNLNPSIDPEALVSEVKVTIDPFSDSERLAGRKNIRMTKWGPYNFKYPLIWNTNPTEKNVQLNFEVLGPEGKWKIIQLRGVKNASIESGTIPSSITTSPLSDIRTDILIELEFTGDAFTDQFGDFHAANEPVKFYFEKFFQPIDFTINWFAIDSVNNPLVTGQLFPNNVRVRPLKTEKNDRLYFAIWGGLKIKETHKQFMTIAEGQADLLAGTYEIGVTWDDAVRVFVDDNLVIDHWNRLSNDYDEAPHEIIELELTEGQHRFRVEHIELGGVAALSLTLQKLDISKR